MGRLDSLGSVITSRVGNSLDVTNMCTCVSEERYPKRGPVKQSNDRYLRQLRARYSRATKKEKIVILDEYVLDLVEPAAALVGQLRKRPAQIVCGHVRLRGRCINLSTPTRVGTTVSAALCLSPRQCPKPDRVGRRSSLTQSGAAATDAARGRVAQPD